MKKLRVAAIRGRSPVDRHDCSFGEVSGATARGTYVLGLEVPHLLAVSGRDALRRALEDAGGVLDE